LFYQVLMLVSFLLAGYQDVKERLVSDYLWIPGVIAAGLALVFMHGVDYALILRIVLIGGIAFAFTFFGFIGQADAIALVLVSSDPAPLAPIPVLVATGAVAIVHIGYLYATGRAGKKRVIPLEQFRKEPKWIPKALIVNGERKEITSDVNISREEAEGAAGAEMVEVQYGVPQVAYIAGGYVAYLVYLAVFMPRVLLSLP